MMWFSNISFAIWIPSYIYIYITNKISSRTRSSVPETYHIWEVDSRQMIYPPSRNPVPPRHLDRERVHEYHPPHFPTSNNYISNPTWPWNHLNCRHGRGWMIFDAQYFCIKWQVIPSHPPHPPSVTVKGLLRYLEIMQLTRRILRKWTQTASKL